MRADVQEADRRHSVRCETRAWHAAEAIDAATLAAIEAAYPDDRRRLGPALRALVAIFTLVAASACFGILSLVTPRSGEEGLVLLFGVALLALTDLQIGPLKRSQAGAEAATALMGVIFTTVGVGLSAKDMPTMLGALLAISAAAALRWGYPLAAAVASVAALCLLARAPGGRLLWIVAGLTLPPLLLRAGDSASLPPSWRASARVVAGVALVGLYFAFHIGSWDHGVVEELGDSSSGWRDGAVRPFFIAGTALVPLGVLAFGARSRRTEFLTLGVLLALASSVTLRFYVHVAPLWVVLSAGGLFVIALGLGLTRFLHGGPDRERFGFTAEPLFDRGPGRGVAEIAAGLAAFAPAAQAGPGPDAVRPGGGRYGGGGASGKY